MGLLSGLKKLKLKDIVGGVGDLAKKAAPIVGLIPGVGTAAGAILGGAGGALGTLNDPGGFNLKRMGASALGGAAMGGAGGAIGHAIHAGGGYGALLGNIKSRLAGTPGMPGGVAAGEMGHPAGTPSTGLLAGIGRTLSQRPELAIGALGALSNARTQGRAANRQDQALKIAMDRYGQTSPFMQLALERLRALDPSLGAHPADPYAA